MFKPISSILDNKKITRASIPGARAGCEDARKVSLSYATVKNTMFTHDSQRTIGWLNASTQFHRLNKLYKHRVIYYGKYCDHYEYFETQGTWKTGRKEYNRKKEGEKSDFSLYRARERLYRLIECNINQHGNFRPIFFTLTSKDQISEYKESNKKIKAFVRRLNTYTQSKIKYVIVPEKHKSGALHYHGVFFNLPFIWVETFKHEIWTYGSVDLQVTKKIKSVSAYLAKYLTKDFIKGVPKNTKMYFGSRGLVYPQEQFTLAKPEDILETVQVKLSKKYIKYKHICKN